MDGVGRDDFGDRELDLKCHEVGEGLLGVELAVRTAAGHPGGRCVDVVDVEHSAASAHSVVA